MEAGIKVRWKMEWSMEEESMSSKMEAIMKENGKIIKFLEQENFISQTISCNMKEIGLMMNSTVLGFNMLNKEAPGLSMREISKMVWEKGLEKYIFQTELYRKGSLGMAKLLVKIKNYIMMEMIAIRIM